MRNIQLQLGKVTGLVCQNIYVYVIPVLYDVESNEHGNLFIVVNK